MQTLEWLKLKIGLLYVSKDMDRVELSYIPAQECSIQHYKSSPFRWKCKLVYPLWKILWQYLTKLNIHLNMKLGVPCLLGPLLD